MPYQTAGQVAANECQNSLVVHILFSLYLCLNSTYVDTLEGGE